MRRNVEYNLRQGMEEYCISDVKLLKAGCQKFREEFSQEVQFDPMERCIMIASACNLYWRRHHLSADCIAVEPAGGWHGARNNQSLKALKWLKWVEHTLREEEGDSGLTARTEDRVTHAGNRGEHAIVTPTRVCYVDDFHPVTQTVYEFHGCVWHGCPRYHPNCRLVPRVHLEGSMEEVYDATCAKIALLRSMGFTVVEMWNVFGMTSLNTTRD